MTKTEATQLVLDEYALWVQDTIVDDKYFYEYASEHDPKLFQALDVINGRLPEGISVNVSVSLT